jgi:hypothetical protein
LARAGSSRSLKASRRCSRKRSSSASGSEKKGAEHQAQQREGGGERERRERAAAHQAQCEQAGRQQAQRESEPRARAGEEAGQQRAQRRERQRARQTQGGQLAPPALSVAAGGSRRDQSDLDGGQFEKNAREASYIVSSEFAKSYRIEERVQEFRGSFMIIRCPFRTLHLKL